MANIKKYILAIAIISLLDGFIVEFLKRTEIVGEEINQIHYWIYLPVLLGVIYYMKLKDRKNNR